MPNMDDFFSSKWLKAEDLNRREVLVTIESVEVVKVGKDDTKPVMFFKGKEKGLVLNKTNSGRLSSAFESKNSDNWLGKEIWLVPETTEFNGQTVGCIRVRAVLPKAEPGTDEEVPF